jgi:hypothetical protein
MVPVAFSSGAAAHISSNSAGVTGRHSPAIANHDALSGVSGIFQSRSCDIAEFIRLMMTVEYGIGMGIMREL